MSTLEQRAADWMNNAACIGADPDLFFPRRGLAGYINRNVDQARTICNTCPVRQACLDYALDHHEVHGIWGGTTPRERRAIRKQRLGMTA